MQPTAAHQRGSKRSANHTLGQIGSNFHTRKSHFFDENIYDEGIHTYMGKRSYGDAFIERSGAVVEHSNFAHLGKINDAAGRTGREDGR